MLSNTSPKLVALNAAIEHVGCKHQKNLAIMVKMLEIKEICRYYDTKEDVVKTQNNPNWRQGLINAVMPHLSEEKQSSLKNILQFMEMQEMMTNLENLKEMGQWS